MNVILAMQFLQAMKLLSVKYTGTGVLPLHAKVLSFQWFKFLIFPHNWHHSQQINVGELCSYIHTYVSRRAGWIYLYD